MDSLGDFTFLQIGIALTAAFGASFVRGLTGFGMAILLVPVLALALLPTDAVMLGNFMSLMIGLLEIRFLAREAERTAWTISGLVALTAPIGLLLLAVTSADVARVVIALIAFSAFLGILLPRRSAEVPGIAATGSVGVISGLMTGYAGMPGPPVVPYYASRNLPRTVIKASMLLIFTVAAGIALIAGGIMGLLRAELAVLALILLPVILAGNRLGMMVSGKIDDILWRSCVGVVLAAAAIGAMVRLF